MGLVVVKIDPMQGGERGECEKPPQLRLVALMGIRRQSRHAKGDVVREQRGRLCAQRKTGTGERDTLPDFCVAAEEMNQCLLVRIPVQEGTPCAEQFVQQVMEFAATWRLRLKAGCGQGEPSAFLGGNHCIDCAILPRGWAQIDQLAVRNINEQEIVKQLGVMLFQQRAQRFEFANERRLHHQIQKIGLGEVPPAKRDGDFFRHRSKPSAFESHRNVILVNGLVTQPAQFVLRGEHVGHDQPRDLVELRSRETPEGNWTVKWGQRNCLFRFHSSVPIPLSGSSGAVAVPVFFYSIKPELAAMKSALLAELFDPLRQNKDEAGDQILRHKLASLRDQTLNYLRVALAAATQAESARNALREKLAEERRQFELLRSELNLFAREQSANALDSFLTQLHPTQTALQEKITAELRAQFPRWKLRLPPLLEAWREWLSVFLNRELTEVSRQQRAVFCSPLQKAQVHLTRTLQAFHDRLAGHVKAALGVTLTPHEFALEVREPQAPPVAVAFAFDAAFTTIGWLIPVTLFRRPVERVLLRKARYEVEKNLSRLAADWRDRVGVAIEDLRRQTELAAQNELETLERMLAQTSSGVPRLREQMVELE